MRGSRVSECLRWNADSVLATATLREILDALKSTYCGSIGVEYMYITETEQKR